MSTSLADMIVPVRGAAQKATSSFVGQLSSPTVGPMEGHTSSPFGDSTPTRTKVTKTYSARGRPAGSKTMSHITPPSHLKKSVPKSITRQPSAKRKARKRELTPSGSSDADTDPFTPPSLSPAITASASRRIRQRAHSLATGRLSMRIDAGTAPSPSLHAEEFFVEKWDLSKLDTFVWVSVNKNAELVDESGDMTERIWWPGKVHHFVTDLRELIYDIYLKLSSHNISPLRVSLIGEIAAESGNIIEISSPSERNIQPMFTSNGNLRFNSTSNSIGEVKYSPRKKPKTNLQSNWQAAVDKMLAEYKIENGGLPVLGLAYSGGSSASFTTSEPDTIKKKVKRKGVEKQSSVFFDNVIDRWSPPPPDPTLAIPGELVFAREQKGTVYWPARLEEYLPPTKPTQKPKFRVRYLDETRQDLVRELFFTSDQDMFSTCKVSHASILKSR